RRARSHQAGVGVAHRHGPRSRDGGRDRHDQEPTGRVLRFPADAGLVPGPIRQAAEGSHHPRLMTWPRQATEPGRKPHAGGSCQSLLGSNLRRTAPTEADGEASIMRRAGSRSPAGWLLGAALGLIVPRAVAADDRMAAIVAAVRAEEAGY